MKREYHVMLTFYCLWSYICFTGAGQDNIVNQLDEEAMEMSFNLPAREVEEMFQKQRRSYFMAGPQRQRNALLSALDFAGF